jgi:prepilin-type processing-associated H-X9-DG protein
MSFRIDDPRGPGLSSRHPGGANAAAVDGQVCFLKLTTSPGSLRALITRAGGEKVNLIEVLHPR